MSPTEAMFTTATDFGLLNDVEDLGLMQKVATGIKNMCNSGLQGRLRNCREYDKHNLHANQHTSETQNIIKA